MFIYTQTLIPKPGHAMAVREFAAAMVPQMAAVLGPATRTNWSVYEADAGTTQGAIMVVCQAPTMAALTAVGDAVSTPDAGSEGLAAVEASHREHAESITTALDRIVAYHPTASGKPSRLLQIVRGTADGAQLPGAIADICATAARVKALGASGSFATSRVAGGFGSLAIGVACDDDEIYERVLNAWATDPEAAQLMATMSPKMVQGIGTNELWSLLA